MEDISAICFRFSLGASSTLELGDQMDFSVFTTHFRNDMISADYKQMFLSVVYYVGSGGGGIVGSTGPKLLCPKAFGLETQDSELNCKKCPEALKGVQLHLLGF